MPPTRKDLARLAMSKADEVRDRCDIAPQSAVNVFDLCGERFNPRILVRFKDISMEGLYLRQAKPEIWLGLRPLVRRVYNCAHELGHHVFGHGTTLDELKSEDEDNRVFEPDEFLVDAFAGYLLMPRLAVVNAFRLRGWKPEEAVPEQFFVVSCSLGVGYETLANHAAFSLGLIGNAAFQKLRRTGLPAIREGMLGGPCSGSAASDRHRPHAPDGRHGGRHYHPAADRHDVGESEPHPCGRDAARPALPGVPTRDHASLHPGWAMGRDNSYHAGQVPRPCPVQALPAGGRRR